MNKHELDIWAWVILNVVIAAAPLLAAAVARSREQKPLFSRAIIDDGILYFLTFLLASGLTAEAIVRYVEEPARLTPRAFCISLLVGVSLCIVAWSSYVHQLQQRLKVDTRPPLWWPLVQLLATLSFVLFMRQQNDLW